MHGLVGGRGPVEHVARVLDHGLGHVRAASHDCRSGAAAAVLGALDAGGQALVDELVRLGDSASGRLVGLLARHEALRRSLTCLEPSELAAGARRRGTAPARLVRSASRVSDHGLLAQPDYVLEVIILI